MTPSSIAQTTGLANELGKPGGVSCDYRWSRIHGRFEWQFFRHGKIVGSAGKPDQVISKVERLVEVE